MEETRNKKLSHFQRQCGLKLPILKMLNTALTHPTYAFEHRGKGLESNQRLEFLGDALLGLIVGEELYRRFTDLPEGDLTKMRASLVCETTLAEKASEINLGDYLLLGRGEEMGGGRARPSILADAFEAVLAAIYLEVGYEAVRSFVLSLLGEELNNVRRDRLGDYKTRFQEVVQKKYGRNVSYKILEETGPDHDKRFLAGVFLEEKLLAEGRGRSKKEAEQNAAQVALQNFETELKTI